jgi:hypothetical protein
LKAHHLFKNLEAPLRYTEALKELNNADHEADWVVAAGEWILRRYKTWVAKQELIAGDLSHP